MNISQKVGKVIFVAAGPGDPELLTLKALKYLQKADVVLTDRLVSPTIINEYVSADAEVIYVGKQSGKKASAPQSTINEFLVQYALQNKLVVRLKGGDVSIFSNILDELETMVAHNISYEIVPGVTAALGAAAYSGIPLTARNLSTSVRFLTSYKTDNKPDAYWKELANTDDTLVFYMSAEILKTVVAQLTQHNINASKLLAVIEQATTPMQTVKTYNLYDFCALPFEEYVSPTLIIIGKVVALHQTFKWFASNLQPDEYFAPLEGKLISYQKKAKRA